MKSCLFFFAITSLLNAQASQGLIDKKTLEKGAKSIDAGINFLLKNQNSDGSWSQHPAMTALSVMALHHTNTIEGDKVDQAVKSGLDYVRQYIQPDGSIWSKKAKEYPNYTTAIALLALAKVNLEQDQTAIRNARNFLMNSQFNDPNTIDYGGIGYGKTGRADLSNLSWSSDALYYTDYLDREPFSSDVSASKKMQDLWDKVQVFVTNCQNINVTNKQDWVSNRREDYGGFVYRPNESKAGEVVDDDGKLSLLSSGSMTYAGLKSMIYAKLDKKDIRVKGAMDYLARNYTVSENPGLGAQGLYYYLIVMARALKAYGEDRIIDKDGNEHNWRTDIINQLSLLQKADGSWVNANGRYMESIPDLVTAYSVATIKIALGRSPY